MNIFKYSWFWLAVILVMLLGVISIKGIKVKRTVLMRMEPSSEYFNLKPEELNSLKKEALDKKDAKAAWRISAYYGCTKKDYLEKDKWDNIAREIESAIDINLNPVGSNNPAGRK